MINFTPCLNMEIFDLTTLKPHDESIKETFTVEFKYKYSDAYYSRLHVNIEGNIVKAYGMTKP